MVAKLRKVILVMFVFWAFQNFWNPVNLTIASSLNEGNEVKLSKCDNGKEIAIKVGDILQIELERFGGTGYEWYLDKSYEKHFKIIKEDTKTVNHRNLVGTPVIRTWRLRAIEEGETEVALYLYRDWESKGEAVETFKIKVKIL